MPCAQVVSLILSILGVVLLLCRMRRDYRARLYHLGTLVWLAHTVIFYSVVVLQNYGLLEVSFAFDAWSSLLRLHMLLTTILQIRYKAVCESSTNGRIRQWVVFFNEW